MHHLQKIKNLKSNGCFSLRNIIYTIHKTLTKSTQHCGRTPYYIKSSYFNIQETLDAWFRATYLLSSLPILYHTCVELPKHHLLRLLNLLVAFPPPSCPIESQL